MTTNGQPIPRRRSPAAEACGTIVALAILTPALAVPVGLAWRVLRWAAGL